MQANDELVKIKKFLPQYRQITRLHRRCNELQQNYNTRKNGYIDIKKIQNDAIFYTTSKSLVILLGVLLSIGVGIFIGMISYLILITMNINIADMPSVFQYVLLGIDFVLTIGISMFVSWMIVAFKPRRNRKKAEKIYNEQVANAKEINKRLDEICSNLSKELNEKRREIRQLTEHVERNPKSPIPKQYWYAADEIYNLIQCGRADTIKEAINLFEDIQHKQRLEDLTAQNAPVYDDHWYERELLKEQVEATKKVERQLDRMRWDLF